MTHLHFDCFSGICGDMVLGAMVDIGIPLDWLQEKLSGLLPPGEFSLKRERVSRHGIQATDVTVVVRDGSPARNYADIRNMIQSGRLPESVKQCSLDIFAKIAEAESKIHGCEIDTVHFHEIGAVDSIVDVVGTALCLERLGISSVSSSEIPLGSGFVECSHGLLPVPAPATAEILAGIPVRGSDVPMELTTPTGAAIVAVLATRFGTLPAMSVRKTGYGAGKRKLASQPNLLRVFWGEEAVLGDSIPDGEDTVCLIETSIDDMNPEIYGHLMERLFEDGALDVGWIPIHMKKNRPGTLVQVLCREERRSLLTDRLLTETTTAGVRYMNMRRKILTREFVEVDTVFGKVAAKKMMYENGGCRIVPEYEECRKIARMRNIPLQTVYDTLNQEFAQAFS